MPWFVEVGGAVLAKGLEWGIENFPRRSDPAQTELILDTLTFFERERLTGSTQTAMVDGCLEIAKRSPFVVQKYNVGACDQLLASLKRQLLKSIEELFAELLLTPANTYLLNIYCNLFTINFILDEIESRLSKLGKRSAFGRNTFRLNRVLRGYGQATNMGWNGLHGRGRRIWDWKEEMLSRASAIYAQYALEDDTLPFLRYRSLEFSIVKLVVQEVGLPFAEAVNCMDRGVVAGRAVLKNVIATAKHADHNQNGAWRNQINSRLAIHCAYNQFLHVLLTNVRNRVAKVETIEEIQA